MLVSRISPVIVFRVFAASTSPRISSGSGSVKGNGKGIFMIFSADANWIIRHDTDAGSDSCEELDLDN